MTDEMSNVQTVPESKTSAVAPGRECCGPTGRARTSKIARLPADIRSEVNERLLDGDEPSAILEWLNGLPEVQLILERSFGSQPITESNLSRWRQGGYAGWLEQKNTQEAVEAVASACAGVDGDAAERLNKHMAVVLSARLFVETQRCGAMPEGPDKTAAWQQLVTSYAMLRRAEYYGVKARHEQDKINALREQARQQEAKRPLSPEERQERIDYIMDTGRYAAKWNNFEQRYEGPGAALVNEEAEITRRVREEMQRRHPDGFPEDVYRPPYASPLPAYPKRAAAPKPANPPQTQSSPARSDSPPGNPKGIGSSSPALAESQRPAPGNGVRSP